MYRGGIYECLEGFNCSFGNSLCSCDFKTRGQLDGYAIIKMVKELTGDELVWSEIMLYPVLHRLEEKNFIEFYWQGSETGRKRKYYRIKEAGGGGAGSAKKRWEIVHSALSKTWLKLTKNKGELIYV